MLNPRHFRRLVVLGFAVALLVGTASAQSINNLQQQNSDMTPLAAGGTTSGSTPEDVQLRADGSSFTSTNETRRIDFEVRETTASYTGTPTHQSATNFGWQNFTFPWTTVSGLTAGSDYKWRARYNGSQFGNSGWSDFNGGQTAFTIEQNVPASSATSMAIAIAAIMGLSLLFVGRRS